MWPPRKGDALLIALARGIGAKAVLTDDKKARKAVEASGIAAAGTPGLLVRAAEEGILVKEEALAAVENLTRTDFRLSRAVVGKAVGLIRES